MSGQVSVSERSLLRLVGVPERVGRLRRRSSATSTPAPTVTTWRPRTLPAPRWPPRRRSTRRERSAASRRCEVALANAPTPPRALRPPRCGCVEGVVVRGEHVAVVLLEALDGARVHPDLVLDARMAPNWNSYHGRWWARLYSMLSDSTAATFGVASSITLSGAPTPRELEEPVQVPYPDLTGSLALLADVLDDGIGHLIGMRPTQIERKRLGYVTPRVLAGPADQLRGWPPPVSPSRPTRPVERAAESMSSWRISATKRFPIEGLTCPSIVRSNLRRRLHLTCSRDKQGVLLCGTKACARGTPTVPCPQWSSRTPPGPLGRTQRRLPRLQRAGDDHHADVDGTAYTITCDPTMARAEAIREIAATPVPAGLPEGICGKCESVVDGAETRLCITPVGTLEGATIVTPPPPQHRGLTRTPAAGRRSSSARPRGRSRRPAGSPDRRGSTPAATRRPALESAASATRPRASAHVNRPWWP